MTGYHSSIFIVLMLFKWLQITLATEDDSQHFLVSSETHSMGTSELPININELQNEDVPSVLKQVGPVNGTGNGTAPATAGQIRPCQCNHGVCSCCSRFLNEMWNQRACVNVSYNPVEFSFTTKMSINDQVLFTRTVSGKNPRPICIPVPRLPAVKACVRLYNIYFPGKNVHACISMEGMFSDVTVFKVKLDCLRLGADGVAVVRPEDGDGIGYVEFLPDDDAGYTDSDDDYDEEDDYDE